MTELSKQLLALSKLGQEELRRKHRIFLSGIDNGISWNCIQMMKEYRFITQEEMNYIIS